MDFDDSNAIRTMDTNSVLTNTFFRMFLGLIASAVTAVYAYYSGMYMQMIINGTFYGLAIAEVVVVILFSLFFTKASPTVVTIMFFGYAFLNGFTLSVIFISIFTFPFSIFSVSYSNSKLLKLYSDELISRFCPIKNFPVILLLFITTNFPFNDASSFIVGL